MEINNLTYIDRYESLRPIGPQATQTLLDQKKIPALQERQYEQWAEYLFSANLPLRLQVAETVFRHDRQHPFAFQLFLVCIDPSAAAIAHRSARKMSPPQPDLTEELMYDGALKLAIRMFQKEHLPAEENFERALYNTMKHGTFHGAFGRMENTHIRSFGSRDRYPRQSRLDEQLSAKQMLGKIANLKHSPETPGRLNNFLRCIIQLGPHNALMPARDAKSLCQNNRSI